MQRQHAPLSCILKFNRATEHFESLRREIEPFFKDDSDNPVFNFEPNHAERVVRLRILRPLPPKWGVIVGDCLYNLRSGLDHLISITAVKHGASDDKTEFPIFLDRQRYAKLKKNGDPAPGSGLAKIEGLPIDAKTYIESIQPYNRTNGPPDLHPLWLLHEISNHDKHRRVDLAHASLAGGHIDIEGLGHGQIERFALPVGVLEDGAIIAHLRPMLGKKLAPKVKVNLKYTPGVVFGIKGPGRGLPISTTLIAMNKFANDIIRSFQPWIR